MSRHRAGSAGTIRDRHCAVWTWTFRPQSGTRGSSACYVAARALTLALRADLDNLPVTEQLELPRSYLLYKVRQF